MFKKLIDKAFNEDKVPSGTLQPKDLEPRLTVHNGVPASATVLAYEPVQRLLAIGSTDGRVKVLGGGVERLFHSPSKAPSRLLQFIVNKGLLVHVTTKNEIEVWNLETCSLQASCEWPTTILTVTAVQKTHYLYVGDEGGLVRVLNVESATGVIQPMAYAIPPTATLAGLVRPRSPSAPALVAILPQPDAQHSRLLLAYQNGLMVLWALHENRVVAIRGGTEYQRSRLTAIPGLEPPTSPPLSEDEDDEEEQHLCSVCWADPAGSLVAAGYDNGDVWLVSFPAGKSPLGDAEGCAVEPARAIQLSTSENRMPITVLRWCAGDKGSKGGRLYIFGGGEMGKPEVITVASLNIPEGSHHHDTHPSFLRRELHWFGPIADLVVAPVAGGDFVAPASAVIVLTTPGQVHLYDEQSIGAVVAQGGATLLKPAPAVPEPVAMTRSMLPLATVSRAWMGHLGATGLELLLQLPRSTLAPPSSLPGGAKWPITGGSAKPARQLADGDGTWWCVLLAGQENGEVHVWDANGLRLQHTASAPNPGAKEEHPLHAVACLDFCPVSGLLAVGHEAGLVRVYVVSREARRLARRSIDQNGQVKKDFIDMGPGFQCLVTAQMHTKTVRCTAIASGPGKVAFGDDDGMVSILDMTSGTFVYMDRPFTGPAASIVSLAFAAFAPPTEDPPPGGGKSKHHRDHHPKENPEVPFSPPTSPPREALPLPAESTVVLYAASALAAVAVMDASTGTPIGAGALMTKNPSKGVALHILDSGGNPVAPLAGPLWCPWATGDSSVVTSPTAATAGSAGLDHREDRGEGSESPKKGGSPRKKRKEKAVLRDDGEAAFVLIVSEECLRLYTTRAIAADKKAERKAVRKEAFKGADCAWSYTLGGGGAVGEPSGLVTLTRSGRLQIRCLPSLEQVLDVALSECVGWEFKPGPKQLRACAATPDGRMLLTDSDTEMVRLSLLASENALGLPGCLPVLHDRQLAAAADAAAEAAAANVAASQPPTQAATPPHPTTAPPGPPTEDRPAGPHKRRSFKENPFTKAVGNVATMVKTVAKDVLGEIKPTPPHPPKDLPPLAPHTADELHGLFATAPFVFSTLSRSELSDLSVASPTAGKGVQIDLDDLDIDDDDLEGATEVDVNKKPSAEYDRSKLFGNLDKGGGVKTRTAAEIRAAYGHGKAVDAAGTAAENRNKLLERQEKLEKMSNKAEDLNAGAANFADMAAELAKQMEKRKWYHL